MRKILTSLVLAVALILVLAVPAAAANPTVSITVTAEVVAITNSQNTWGIGTVATSATVYFSADGNQDDNYSRITNTGSVAVDVEIQGDDIEGGDYDWTLADTGDPGTEIYGLNATSGNGTGTYTTIVKSSSYNDITTDLAADDVWDWSMKFAGPTAFNANDDGEQKSTTVTLVASKHT